MAETRPLDFPRVEQDRAPEPRCCSLGHGAHHGGRRSPGRRRGRGRRAQGLHLPPRHPRVANARPDLTEALTFATRCGFRLHECDAHLGLALAESTPSDPRPHPTRARAIIDATGYHRRDAELADLERRITESEAR